MLGHAMFHNTEAVSNVLVCFPVICGSCFTSIIQILIRQAMSVLHTHKPEHIIYNSCCIAKQQAVNIPWFDGVGMCRPLALHKQTQEYRHIMLYQLQPCQLP